jgi:hypothetical protein
MTRNIGNLDHARALELEDFRYRRLEFMGGNIGGHDGRYVDLAVAIVLLIIVGAYGFYCSKPTPVTTTAFIVPSQTTRW